MALETLYKTVNTNGEYSCGDIGISYEEWLSLLDDDNAKPYINVLTCFLREQDHKGTCGDLSFKYGKPSAHYNIMVSKFSQWVQKKLNRFKVIGTDGNETFWCITMQKGWDTKQGFQWQLRDELVEALRDYLMQELIKVFHTYEPFNGYKEEYKWALLDQTEGKDVIDIIRNIKGKNIIDNPRVDGVLKTLLDTKEEELRNCGNHLLDESIPLIERLADFKEGMRVLCPKDWKNYANDERTAAAILLCKYPEKYTVYMDTVYQLLCQYFGFESQKAGLKYNHFMHIINRFSNRYGEEIQNIMLPQIGKYKNKPIILAVQTLFWCMQEKMNAEMKRETINYWLTGFNYGKDSQFDRFVKEGIWESIHWDDNKSDQKQLALAKTISKGDIIILKSTSTKGKNHSISFLKIKAVGVVQSDVSSTKIERDNRLGTQCQCSVNYVNVDEKDFDGSPYGSYQMTIHKADNKINDVIDYVNGLIFGDTMPQQKYKEYIELLQETHNLVLTGAPGTGKTFMAQEIAKEMGAVTRFVQFHPSYDYTDFVEGLRPVEKNDGQLGFERKDGIFKEFCREAIKNLVDSEKTVETLTKEMSWEEKLQQFIENAIEHNTPYKLINGNEFYIEEIKGRTITVRNEKNEKTGQISVNADEIIELLTNEVPLNIVRDIRNYFKRKFGTQPDSYAYIITKEIRKMKQPVKVENAQKIERKPFVLIIDEINRGEASKIFGELFYAIDPGYRGKKDTLVQTQYQNLVPESDVFANGFYVPENVYILATMNDIDRSVESMDFAMRRRFTWKEITPTDTESMLDTLSCVAEAKATMARLNDEIAKTEGLGAAYMIGPAYFLKLNDNGGDFNRLWKMNIEPLLKEYLRGFRKFDTILAKFNKTYFNPTEASVNAPSSDEN